MDTDITIHNWLFENCPLSIRKYLRTRFLRTVNPYKHQVYNFKKKKLEKWKPFHRAKGSGSKVFPVAGFVCPVCEQFNNQLCHYFINNESICEICAIEWLIDNDKYIKQIFRTEVNKLKSNTGMNIWNALKFRIA